jgi:general secretion pathway protein H
MNKKGVTIIELIIVIVIIAVGAVLLAPNIGAWLNNYRLRTATRDVVSILRVAQMKAVSSSMDYRVSFNVAGGNYILQYNTSGLWVNDGSTQSLPSKVTFSTTFTNPTDMALFRNDSSSNGGSIIIQNARGDRKTITVLFTTGKITIK